MLKWDVCELFVQESYREKMSQVHAQMSEAKNVIEQLEKEKSDVDSMAKKKLEDVDAEKAIALAEFKQQMHVTMETKDQEMQVIHNNLRSIKAENEALKEKIAALEKEGECHPVNDAFVKRYVFSGAYFTNIKRVACLALVLVTPGKYGWSGNSIQ